MRWNKPYTILKLCTHIMWRHLLYRHKLVLCAVPTLCYNRARLNCKSRNLYIRVHLQQHSLKIVCKRREVLIRVYYSEHCSPSDSTEIPFYVPCQTLLYVPFQMCSKERPRAFTMLRFLRVFTQDFFSWDIKPTGFLCLKKKKKAFK